MNGQGLMYVAGRMFDVNRLRFAEGKLFVTAVRGPCTTKLGGVVDVRLEAPDGSLVLDAVTNMGCELSTWRGNFTIDLPIALAAA